MPKATRHSIGHPANLANLPPSTIRFYEQIGLLSSSRKTPISHRRSGVSIQYV
ncbi:MAG: MerR family DNA-binding transcriptional regulator [bacterium]